MQRCMYIFLLSAHPIHERKVFYMNLDKTVCYCMSVTNGMIKDAVASGAATLEEVQDITGAGTVCGSCLDEVKRLVEEFVSEGGEK